MRRLAIAIGMCLLLGLAVPSPEAADDDANGWKRVFQDDFNRSSLGKDWQILEGTWRIEDGKLIGDGGTVICTRNFPGAQRIEYEAQGGKTLCDLSALLGANEKGYIDACFFGFGSNGNRKSKILVSGKQIATADARIEKGQTHRIACERDARRLRLWVDGRLVIDTTCDAPPVGATHEQIGLYAYGDGAFDNVKVFTKPEKLQMRAHATGVEWNVKRLSEAERLPNGSFERSAPVMGAYPADWADRRGGEKDFVRLVTDAGRAHRGWRFVRMTGRSDAGVELHAVPRREITMTPGAEYVVRFRARAESGSPEVTVVPPEAAFQPTNEWQCFTAPFTQPDAKAYASDRTGFLFRVKGGTVDLDDVSLLPADAEPAVTPALAADYAALRVLEGNPQWHAKADGWALRIPIQVACAGKRPAFRQAATTTLRDLFRVAPRYDYLTPDGLLLVDATTGKAAPVALRSKDKLSDVSYGDEVAFRVDCPPNATKTYHLYIRSLDKTPAPLTLASAFPKWVAKSAKKAASLAWRVDDPEVPTSMDVRIAGSTVEGTVRALAAEPKAATLTPPGADQGMTLALEKTGPHTWSIQGALADATKGLCKLVVTLKDEEGGTVEVVRGVVADAALWGAPAIEKITCRTDRPTEAAPVAICAARNEAEAFQVAVDAGDALSGVVVTADDFTHSDGASSIPAERVKVEWAKEVYVGRPCAGTHAGYWPDPLVPWDATDMRPGERRVAWITVSVPEDAKPGTYQGSVRATTAGGKTLALPVALEVFDFALPDRLAFTLDLSPHAYWGWFGWRKVDNWGSFSRLPDPRPVYELDELLVTRHATPKHEMRWNPYGVPWRWHPDTQTVTADFSRLDEYAPKLLAMGAKYLWLSPGWTAGWVRPGRVIDGGWARKDWPTKYEIQGNTPEGKAARAAWAKTVGDHLAEKGWLDKTFVYVSDEPANSVALKDAVEYSEVLHENALGIRTMTAGHAHGRVYPYIKACDAFSGFAGRTEEEATAHIAEMKKTNTEYWGPYNRPLLIPYPLANARVVGPDSFFLGSSHYFNYAAAFWSWSDEPKGQNHWLNPGLRRYVRHSPFDTFLSEVGDQGMSNYVYLNWLEGKEVPAKYDQPIWSSSIRLEALRETAEDYEYLKMLSESGSKDADALLAEMRALIRAGRHRGAGHHEYLERGVYTIDPAAYNDLRRRIGRAISAK